MKAVSLLLKRWLFLSFLCLKLPLTPAEQQNTFQNVHFAEWTFTRKPIFQNRLFPECTFGRMDISPKTYFPE